MTTVTSAEIINALVVYSVCHLVTAVALNLIRFMKRHVYTKYHLKLHEHIKSRPRKEDDSIAVAVSETLPS